MHSVFRYAGLAQARFRLLVDFHGPVMGHLELPGCTTVVACAKVATTPPLTSISISKNSISYRNPGEIGGESGLGSGGPIFTIVFIKR